MKQNGLTTVRIEPETPGSEPGSSLLTVPRRRICIIYNPAAGGRRRRRLDAVLRALEDLGCRVALQQTAASGDAERLASAAAREGFDALVVAGGDGTINEVVNGLSAAALGPGAPPVAILPLGTANVLAAEIGAARDAGSLAASIVSGPARAIPLGSANGRLFVMMAGVGFDAHVVAAVDRRLKRRIGKAAYVVEYARQLARFPYPEYRVIVDGRAHAAGSAIVSRGRFYAGRHVVAPDARLDAPQLHVCLFQRRGAWHAVRYGAALLAGRLHRLSDYRIVPGRRVRIEGPLADPVQGDGEIVARLPVEIALAASPLRLIVPDREPAGRG